jgi:hypothetical protein
MRQRPINKPVDSNAIRRSRSTVCSSEPFGNRDWVTPTIEDCDHFNH